MHNVDYTDNRIFLRSSRKVSINRLLKWGRRNLFERVIFKNMEYANPDDLCAHNSTLRLGNKVARMAFINILNDCFGGIRCYRCNTPLRKIPWKNKGQEICSKCYAQMVAEWREEERKKPLNKRSSLDRPWNKWDDIPFVEMRYTTRLYKLAVYLT